MTDRAFSASISVRASIARLIWRSTSPPMRMIWRRRSSSCSEKCSFMADVPFSVPEGFGRQRLEILLQDFVAAGRHGPQRDVAVEDPFEQVGLLAGGVELGLAVGARRNLE